MAYDNPRDVYEVGYGKPPKESRFKPGQSGNPKGRPKNKESLRAKVEKILDRRVSVTANGQKQTLPWLDASLAALAQAALQGPVDKRIMAVRFLLSLAPLAEPQQEEFNYTLLTDEELDILEAILVKAGGGGAEA
jgi:hypothetical protein